MFLGKGTWMRAAVRGTAVVFAVVVPLFDAEQLTFSALQLAELDTGSQRNRPCLKFSTEYLEGGSIGIESSGVDVQPVLHVFYPSFGAAFEVLIKAIYPFSVIGPIARRKPHPRLAQAVKAYFAGGHIVGSVGGRHVEFERDTVRQREWQAVVNVLLIQI